MAVALVQAVQDGLGAVIVLDLVDLRNMEEAR